MYGTGSTYPASKLYDLGYPCWSGFRGMHRPVIPAFGKAADDRPIRMAFVNTRLIGFSKIFKEHVYES